MCPIKLPCTSISKSFEKPVVTYTGNTAPTVYCYLTPNWKNVNQFLNEADLSFTGKIEFLTGNVLEGIIFAISEISKTAIYEQKTERSTKRLAGISHCDINPSNILVSSDYKGSNTEVKITGFLGKHEVSYENVFTPGVYKPSLNSCYDTSNVKYYSPRRAKRYFAELNKLMSNNDVKGEVQQINEEYNVSNIDNLLALEDDLWSALFSIHEICYPQKTFNQYAEEILKKHNTNESICELEKSYSKMLDHKMYKTLCLKSLFYIKPDHQKRKRNNYNYEGSSFYEFFDFSERCEFYSNEMYQDIGTDEYSMKTLKGMMNQLIAIAKGQNFKTYSETLQENQGQGFRLSRN
eukprot:GHVR01131931.1.p1 GENE.GHVR01131931.1~~GHVR01131931.1.p1  ORF type:complete len:350 (+),score=29.33 GHVR01131931.1:274-1323(+)